MREQPSVLFMHIEATADEAALGQDVRKILDAVEAVRQAHAVAPAVTEVRSDIDTKRLEEIVGAKGESKDGVFKFTLGRPHVPVRCTGAEVWKSTPRWATTHGRRSKGRTSVPR